LDECRRGPMPFKSSSVQDLGRGKLTTVG